MEGTRELFSARGLRVVVTGGSRGIGRMIATGFTEAGAEVIVSSRNAEACATTARELGEACTAVPADLGTEEGAAALIAAVNERWDGLDVLVNNAGATWGAPLDEYPLAAFDKLWRINLRGVFALTQGLLPALRGAASAERPARIINIGSIDALRVPAFENYAYSASKAALHMLTRHLASTLAADAITVNAIAPGPFYSKMMAAVLDDEETGAEIRSMIPLGRLGAPGDAAGMAIFLASPASCWVTGAVIPLDGGVSLRH